MIRLLLSSALLALCAAAATPPFSFTTRTDLKTTASVAVVSADFNGDGLGDIAALGAISIELFLGQGNRRFAAPTSIPLAGQPDSYDTMTVADINGDGKPDLLASSGNQTLIFFGKGDGTFTPGPTIPTWGLPVVAADFNLDGKLDLAFAQGDVIEVLLGNGDGTFSHPVMLHGPGGCVASGDFNNDGKPDILGCDGTPFITIFPGRGDGTFGPPINSAIPSEAIFATVGDLNNDGNLDVAAVANHNLGANPNLGPIYVLYGNGDGSFQPALQVHTDIGAAFSVAIGDLNGDGLPDLVAASIGGLEGGDFQGGLVGTYFNNGAEGFTLGAVYPVTFINGLPWATMVLADLDGDQRPDLLESDGGGLYFSTLFNDKTGKFQDIQALHMPDISPAGLLYGTPAPVAQADFNGDGLGDLGFVISLKDGWHFAVFEGTGNPAHPFRGGALTALHPPSKLNPFSMVAADFNGDGKVDIAVSYSNLMLNHSFVKIYLGNEDGTFSDGAGFSVAMVGAQMIAADFNGDGKMDLASSSGFLALGNGDGTFQAPTVFYQINPLNSTFGVWLGAADFNHDGKMDLAFQTPENPGGDQPLLIFLGNGDGTFQNPVSYSWGYLPAAGAIADLNNDGSPDIVILSSQHPQDEVAIFIGHADGSFDPAAYVSLAFTAAPLSIVAADFNGDGNPDLALMDSGGSTIHLFAGNGDGTFGPDQEFGAAVSMSWMGGGNYQAQTKSGFADLVTVDAGANNFFTPTKPVSSAISTLLNTACCNEPRP